MSGAASRGPRLRGLRRGVVTLLAGLMVPVVLVATTDAANAVPQTAGVAWNFDGTFDLGYGPYECGTTITFDAGDTTWSELFCYGGSDISPGTGQPAEEGTPVMVWLTGTDCGGFASDTWDRGSRDGLTLVHGVKAELATGSGANCDPAQACIRISGGGSTAESCQPVGLTLDDPAPSECQWAAFERPLLEPPFDVTGTTTHRWTRRVKYQPSLQPLGPNDMWITYLVLRDIGGTTLYYPGRNVGRGAVSLPADPIHSPRSETSAIWRPGDGQPDPGESQEVIGAGIMRAAQNPHTGVASYLPQQQSYGAVGVTDPALCRFYWGEQVAVTSDDTDIPAGPMGGDLGGPVVPDPPPPADPDPVESGCAGFSITDPASWGGAAACAMVALLSQALGILGDLVAAVLGLVADLLAGLLGLLLDLFVPDPGSWNFGPALDHLTSRAPFSIVADVGDGATALGDSYRNSGSCGGVIADFDTGQGFDDDAQLTCTGLAGTPGYGALYSLVSAGLIACTGLALFRMFAGYFQDTAS